MPGVPNRRPVGVRDSWRPRLRSLLVISGCSGLDAQSRRSGRVVSTNLMSANSAPNGSALDHTTLRRSIGGCFPAIPSPPQVDLQVEGLLAGRFGQPVLQLADLLGEPTVQFVEVGVLGVPRVQTDGRLVQQPRTGHAVIPARAPRLPWCCRARTMFSMASSEVVSRDRWPQRGFARGGGYASPASSVITRPAGSAA